MSERRHWYHLSPDPELPNPIKTVAEPQFDYLDIDENCWCVAPTVWQCLVAITPTFKDEKVRYIYEFEVKSPIPATTGDRKIVDEYRITANVLEANNGEVRTERIGIITFNSPLVTDLKAAIRMGVDLPRYDENKLLWDTRDGIWRPRFHTATEIRDRAMKM